MRQLLCFIFLITCSVYSFSQKKWILNKNSIIKDSSGYQYKYKEWKPLLKSREYIAVALDTANENTSFILQRVTDEMRKKWLKNSPKPRESPFFRTGKKFPSFKARTINGEKINTKDLKGKILVINYWFIDCMPCRKEIPELNDLVKHVESDSNIVFISIAKDPERDLKNFLRKTPFSYKIIGYNAGGRGITIFPTNVVVDKEGNVAFHSTGYSSHTVYWIRKTIEELQTQTAQESTNTNQPY